MDGILERLAELEKMVLQEQRQGVEEKRRAAEKVRWSTRLLEIITEFKALAGGAIDLPEGEAAECASEERPAYDRRGVLERLLGPGVISPPFAPFDRDEETGEPVLDTRAVAGKRTNRQRAFGAAMTYGPILREVSLADAIFRTGETRASSAASIRSSLGGLVRYGKGWKRDRGTLTYVGDDLTPNRELILQLVRERNERERRLEVGDDLS